ncbi:MAG: DUF1415 domain-containing protein [Rhodocyclaceae bacterium]|nr:MAG: DUF1415 domain-containing protein [Rhodocyclaceae bacterium]
MNQETSVLKPYADAAEVEAIVAATRHWLETAVIGLNLCPFAKAVHVKKQVHYAVTMAESADDLLAELAHEFRLLAQTDAKELDTTLLIHPKAMTAFIDYHFFLQEADALLRNEGYEGIFQIASLHPQYEFAGSEPEDIENYTNRSPYPTLHLLREESIDRAVAAFPNAEDIYERNMETLRRLGHEGWRQLLAAEPDKQ